MPTAILWPAIVQALLTFAVLIVMGVRRRRSMRAANLSINDPDVALGRAAWDDDAAKAARNYDNLFELPVLFFAVIAFALHISLTNIWMTALAWVFVASRIVHSVEHLGPNRISVRGPAFLVGAAALLAMWLTLAWRIV